MRRDISTGKADAQSVLDEAETALAKEFAGKDPDKARIRDATTDVANRLSSAGLKKLAVIPTKENGELVIRGYVNPVDDLLKLLPKGSRGKSAKVKTVVRIPMAEPDAFVEIGERSLKGINFKQKYVKRGPADLEGRTVERIGRDGKKRVIYLDSNESIATSSVSGVRLIPEKTANVIDLATWNVGKTAYEKGTNESHAEHAFVKWLAAKLDEPGWAEGVREIDLENVKLSPCDACCVELVAVLERLRRLSAESGGNLTAKINWGQLYDYGDKEPQHTTADGIRRLVESGWAISPSAPCPRAQKPPLWPQGLEKVHHELRHLQRRTMCK